MEALSIAFILAITCIFSQPPADRIVLLPGPDGKAGIVIVKTASGEQRLDVPYATAEVSANGAISTEVDEAAAVTKRYAKTLAAQPPRPISLTVYFVSGSDQLTPESLPVIEQLKAELARRPAPEVVVIGHTDLLGGDEDNDKLSLLRADAMRQVLIDAGVPAREITVAGRGKREPIVPTANGVSEPRNRRVEISIR